MNRKWNKTLALAACSATLLLATSGLSKGDLVTRRWGSAPKAAPAQKTDVPRGKAPTAYAVETKTPPKLDGNLDDAVWKDAPSYEIARTLDGGSKAAQPSEFKLLRDAKTLYVAVRAFEPLIDKVQATRRGKDGAVWSDDSIEIFLGTGGVYYQFGINAAGSVYDAQGKDASWNCDIQAASGRGKTEWTLEIAIPLAPIAGEGKLPKEWIANFNRNRQTTGNLEESSWSPTYSGDSHVPDRFGKLLFEAPPAEKPGEGKPERPVVKKKEMEIMPAGNGDGVVRFDLANLPKGATVYRADLIVFRSTAIDGRMDEAMKDIEIYPLFAEFKAGEDAKPADKPVLLREPWYDRFDVTDAVRQWVQVGKTNGGFFVKVCPFWNAEATCLDVAYEGTPDEDLPKQASGVKAVHRAGQTFITWKEITEPVGTDEPKWGQVKMILDNIDQAGRLRYCVYRHSVKITAKNLREAQLIATVKPLSGWNLNGRNVDRPIDIYIATQDVLMTGHWNPFQGATVDGDFGRDCPIDRLVIQDGAEPLPRGTGLYVHSTPMAGRWVGTPSIEGAAKQMVGPYRTESYYAVVTSLDGVENTKDISDANSLAAPVSEQGAYGEPVLQREIPKMPFFNFPQKLLHYVQWVDANIPSQYYNWSVGVPDNLGKDVPLELNLHRDGHSYWRTHYRIERDSIVLCPYDFPIDTWWYGYHESYGTLRSFKQGGIQPYTEYRLIGFVKWAERKWPVDENRVLVTGCRGGASGSGALHLGMLHPEVFNLVISGHGAIDYGAVAKQTDRRGLAQALEMQAVWGKTDWNLKTADGKEFWPQHDLVALVNALPAAADLPYVTLSGSAQSFLEAMLAKRYGIMGEFAWGGSRYIPVSNSGTYPNVIRLDIRKNKSYLAFVIPGDPKARYAGDQLNREFRWSDIADEPDKYEVTLMQGGRGGSAADVTLRRLQKFKVEPGKTYAWKNGAQTGTATVGEDGLLVLKGVKFAGSTRLVVTKE